MGYTDAQGKRAKAMKTGGGRYSRSAEEKKRLENALAGYSPGSLTGRQTGSTQTPKKKKKKVPKRRKSTLGGAYSRNADQVLRDVQSDKY